MVRRPKRRPKQLTQLERRRRLAGLTQRALGFQVGCDHSLISHYETGRRTATPDMPAKIAKVLRVVDAGELFDADGRAVLLEFPFG